MNQFLDWVKANVFIVVFSVLMIVAPVAMFLVASGMNQRVRDEVSKRGTTLGSFNTLQVDVGTDGQKVLPNEQLLREYARVTNLQADDAATVGKLALELNRKDHKPAMPGVFPEPPFEMREVIPKRYHERLVAAYNDLLSSVGAGAPPGLEDLREQLERTRNLYITQDLKKDTQAALTPEEDLQLKGRLSEYRLFLYREAAGKVRLYASPDVLSVPAWDQTSIPSPAQMFNWQWQFWAIEDVLNAIKQVNEKAESVMDAPVKHVLGVAVHDLPQVASGEGDGSLAASPSGGNSMGSGFGGESAGTAGEGIGAPVQGQAPDGGGAVGGQNYAASFTGLVSSPTYDVLGIDLALVVETARLPEVLDALSRYNFMTITNLRVEPADAFAATESGYYYGPAPVCHATVRLDSVWLRDWTTPLMPKATREALGIPADAPTPAADGTEAPG